LVTTTGLAELAGQWRTVAAQEVMVVMSVV
jgi:hypothetical protein